MLCLSLQYDIIIIIWINIFGDVKKTNDNNHDIKVNIRKYSFIENFKADLRMVYFIIFYNFALNYLIYKAFNNAKEFAKDINIPTISRKNIAKIYNTIRIKIKNEMHLFWHNNLMGIEPSTDGKSQIEIDESKVITHDNNTRWMFGIFDRGNYDIRIFYVNDNRTKETLLPIIKKMFIHIIMKYIIIKIRLQLVLMLIIYFLLEYIVIVFFLSRS